MFWLYSCITILQQLHHYLWGNFCFKSMRFMAGQQQICIFAFLSVNRCIITNGLHVTDALTLYIANWQHSDFLLLPFYHCVDTSNSLWRWQLIVSGRRHAPHLRSEHFKGSDVARLPLFFARSPIILSSFWSCCSLHCFPKCVCSIIKPITPPPKKLMVKKGFVTGQKFSTAACVRLEI